LQRGAEQQVSRFSALVIAQSFKHSLNMIYHLIFSCPAAAWRIQQFKRCTAQRRIYCYRCRPGKL